MKQTITFLLFIIIFNFTISQPILAEESLKDNLELGDFKTDSPYCKLHLEWRDDVHTQLIVSTKRLGTDTNELCKSKGEVFIFICDDDNKHPTCSLDFSNHENSNVPDVKFEIEFLPDGNYLLNKFKINNSNSDQKPQTIKYLRIEQ